MLTNDASVFTVVLSGKRLIKIHGRWAGLKKISKLWPWQSKVKF